MKPITLIVTAIVVLLFVFAAFFVYHFREKKEMNASASAIFIHNEGTAQGTTYSIVYQHPTGLDLHKKIKDRLSAFDQIMSSYVPASLLSRINRNEVDHVTDKDFINMVETATEVSVNTSGAFDITVAPLVKLWGFGAGQNHPEKIPAIESVKKYVGYQKFQLKNNNIQKERGVLIDANAIAQGQSVDIIAKLLEKHGCKNYMVEIGGELICKGVNTKRSKWRIGIDKPVDIEDPQSEVLQEVLEISNCAVATSGNYRKYFYMNGKKYSHEIDPRSGFPVSNNMLSATVVAPTCMLADAYATAFMVMGVDKSLTLCRQMPSIQCFLLYADAQGNVCTIYSPGFKKFLTKN